MFGPKPLERLNSSSELLAKGQVPVAYKSPSNIAQHSLFLFISLSSITILTSVAVYS